MRKLIIITALLLASASAQAQSLDIGSVLSANGISTGQGTDQLQSGAMQGGAGQQAGAGAQAGAGQQGGRRHASARQSRGKTRESAQETKARSIAAKYGVSW